MEQLHIWEFPIGADDLSIINTDGLRICTHCGITERYVRYYEMPATWEPITFTEFKTILARIDAIRRRNEAREKELREGRADGLQWLRARSEASGSTKDQPTQIKNP